MVRVVGATEGGVLCDDEWLHATHEGDAGRSDAAGGPGQGYVRVCLRVALGTRTRCPRGGHAEAPMVRRREEGPRPDAVVAGGATAEPG